jgi:hypothetical protein
MTEPMLPSLDVLGSDEELAEAARAQRDAAPAHPPGDAEGRDASRAVTVRMEPTGRVGDVVISNWWRDDLSPSDLSGALVEAYQDALGQTLSRTVVTVPEGPPAGAVPLVEPIESGLDDVAWFEEIRRSNDRAASYLERADELGRTGVAERVVTGGAGIVRLHVTGGTVTAAEIDVHAALQETPATVAADARAAFQAIR